MKKSLFALLHAMRVTNFAAWCNRRRTIFLCYHGVTKRPTRSPDDPKGLHVNHLRFAGHLDFLSRHYRVISLRDYLLAQRQRRSLPEYSVVLTFDDGFRNFLTAAAPLLAERDMPATVFLITDKARDDINEHRDTEWSQEDDRRHLSWAEALALKATQRVDFGSHTCSHSGLLNLSQESIDRELVHSRNDLISRLAVEMAALSYPKGQYSELLAAYAHKLGYDCAVTTDRGLNELDHDPFTLGRTLIGDYDDEASFAVRVSGLRCWLVKVRDLLWPRLAGQPRVTTPYSDVGRVLRRSTW